jgi:hypothetical protein
MDITWKGATWQADVICTPKGDPYAYQIYGWCTSPGTSREDHWVPYTPTELSILSIESARSVLDTVGTINLQVTLNPEDPSRTVGVSYATANGTAIAGLDYTAASGTLTFLPTQTTLTIPITILNRSRATPSTFTVTLSGATNAQIGNAIATITILPDAGST